MNEDYMEKLVNDIQQYLREEDKEKQIGWNALADSDVLSHARHPLLVGLITLLSACAVGSITVAILLFGFVGSPATGPVDIMAMLAVAGCGIFFSAMLVSVWKRLVLLQQIERTTRQILESKERANALLEYFLQHME
jgi:hypothetical protein